MSERAKQLAEKKRRLEDLKKQRRAREELGNSDPVRRSKAGDLNNYIDELLNKPPPKGAPVVSFSDTTSEDKTPTVSKGASSKDGDSTVGAVSSPTAKPSTADSAEAPPKAPPKVTFEMCTQTNEDEFPLPPLMKEDDDETKQSNDDDDDNDGSSKKGDSQNQLEQPNPDEPNEESDTHGSSNDPQMTTQSKQLSEQEINATISSKKFTSFFNSASKKVERFLGSSILADLLVDDNLYYTDLESKRNDASKNLAAKSSHSLISKQIPFQYSKWTSGRDITSIDWSNHHRGEVLLASYHVSSSSTSSDFSPTGNGTVISSKLPNATPSSSLLPRSRSEITQADGLNIVWNLTMPNRPEHILTCGSPVLQSKFHPTEGSLVVGACYSGQVVVWDVRSGRLPVQRSTLNLLGGGSGTAGAGGGHVHPVIGMEVLDGGSGFVTAASDGTVNFWSLANLIEPAESLKIQNGNLSSIAVAPETQSIIASDESGSLHAIVPPSIAAATGGSASAGVGGTTSGSGRSRRTNREFKCGKKNTSNYLGHYGPVTGLSTKTTSQSDDMNGGTGVSLSRGFARGTKGMVLTCGVDWTTKLWAPAYSDKPLLSFLSHSYDYMSDVQWSPIHPSIFASASSNGTLAFWNMASSIDEPVTGLDGIALEKNSETLSSPRGINKLQWSADGRRIAAACSDTLYVLGLTEELWKPNGDEDVRFMNNLKSRGLLDEE